MSHVVDGRVFEAPDKGAWELEATHFQRPFTPFTSTALAQGMPIGFARGSARFGIMLSHFKPAMVHGFCYMKAVAFGAPEGAVGPPPKLVLQLLTRLHPKIRRRLRAGADAFEQKVWRDDLRRWDEEIKPTAIALQRRHQAVVLADLDDEALLRHLETLWKDLVVHFELRHTYTIPAAVTVGDFVAHVRQWTGTPTGAILSCLRGSSPVSAGIARAEVGAVADAVRADGSALELLRSARPPGELVAALQNHPGPVGEAMRAYVELVGVRCVGYDAGEGTALDYPELLVRAIRRTLDGDQALERDRGKEQLAALRALVPLEHRGRFDELFDEARVMNRLRDERGTYTDSWLNGLGRRTILEAGRRLVARGRLGRATSLLDASLEEIGQLVRGTGGPTAAELESREQWRLSRSIGDVPPWLGAPPSGPPPAEWLPEHGRRAARAAEAFISALFDVPAKKAGTTIEGLAVSDGSYVGRARLVLGPDDLARVEKGDVLVARTTGPTFNVVLPLLGGIVTDRGGQLSHAAVVAREYGIPAVVGTTTATQIIRDGDRVSIDGTRGRVEVLG